MTSKVHPELADQLARAGTSLLQAVVQLRATYDPDAIPSPDEVTKLANMVLERVATTVGHSASRTNVLRNVASLIVEADPKFMRALIQQPEVVSALPNQTTESPFIAPKGKRPA
jgi:DNA polymerase II small subunit/DNA polymerase delta subunit B